MILPSSPFLNRTTSISSNHSTPHGSPWIRKPLSVVRHQQKQQESVHNTPNYNNKHVQNNNEQQNEQLHRHLSVWDLIGIGVGGTIGSGIFVLTGQIASQYSGSGAFLSMAIAGIAATCSAVCYAELSGRIPAAGSTYVYAYICWGEIAAVVASACLTLEYGIAGAAVARTWGDKVIEWLEIMTQQQRSDTILSGPITYNVTDATMITSFLLPFNGAVNIPAFLVSAGSTVLLLAGVSESKSVMNFITALKMFIVAVMIIGGFFLYDKTNMPPYTSLAPYGFTGILRGSTTSFFAYLGYDEVCCVAGESKNPVRDMPRAVIGTLLCVTISYILASVALTGMLPYNEISPTSGFPAAFEYRGVGWLADFTALGEILTLPVVVLISLLAQPRLLYSMAQDGLLPKVFGKVDPATGNLIGGTAISGIFMTIIAAIVPFAYLDDLISTGILVVFTMTNSCLVLLRCKHKSTSTRTRHENTWLLESLLIFYNALCFTTAMLWTHSVSDITSLTATPVPSLFAVLSTALTILCLLYMLYTCPTTSHFGGSILEAGDTDRHIPTQPFIIDDDGCKATEAPLFSDQEYFVTPAVPLLPCFGMAVNWYLIAQLSTTGILLLCLYLLVTIALYGIACAPYSVGHLYNWNNNTYETVQAEADIPIHSLRLKNDNHDNDVDCEDDDNEYRRLDSNALLKQVSKKLQRTNSF